MEAFVLVNGHMHCSSSARRDRFIEAGDMVESKVVGAKDREAAYSRVVKASSAISRADFSPTPSPHKCGFCDFASMCPAAYGVKAGVGKDRLALEEEC